MFNMQISLQRHNIRKTRCKFKIRDILTYLCLTYAIYFYIFHFGLSKNTLTIIMVLIYKIISNFWHYRVLMNCIYTGNFNEEHITNRKRRMIGPALKKSSAAVMNNLSCEFYREIESTRLMKMGIYCLILIGIFLAC